MFGIQAGGAGQWLTHMTDAYAWTRRRMRHLVQRSVSSRARSTSRDAHFVASVALREETTRTP